MSETEVGVPFLIQRNGSWENVDIAQMSSREIAETLKDKEPDFLIRLVEILVRFIRDD